MGIANAVAYWTPSDDTWTIAQKRLTLLYDLKNLHGGSGSIYFALCWTRLTWTSISFRCMQTYLSRSRPGRRGGPYQLLRGTSAPGWSRARLSARCTVAFARSQ
eukprot:1708927-Pyramimonas_sp.AAC.1